MPTRSSTKALHCEMGWTPIATELKLPNFVMVILDDEVKRQPAPLGINHDFVLMSATDVCAIQEMYLGRGGVGRRGRAPPPQQ